MSMSSIINYLKKQSFQPNFLSLFINPFFFIRRGLYKQLRKHSSHLHGEMLDFGCGRKPYKNLFTVNKYIGVDIETSGHSHKNSEVDIFYNGKTLPFPNESFDSFLCSEVFEHLFNLDEIITELKRVLRPGGKGVITVPFAWPEHEVPYDYARYTSFGVKSLLEKNGLKIISLEKSGHFVECLVQQGTLYIYTLFQTKSAFLNTLCTLLFISPFNIIGFILAKVLPKNRDLFHNIIIVVEK